ncbi:MAG: hypothetical protein GXO76_03010 [Calditrichaeota bacterium]|nr:hypothetical protein [Calditrichota bacterium]
MSYCVLTADIHQSRLVANRQELQDQIEASLQTVNQTFASSIGVPFTITLGDEWQGIVQTLSAAYEIAVYFIETFHPVRLAIGIGEGKIETAWRQRSSEMDGEAFHRSRNALEEARRKNRRIRFATSRTHEDVLLNAITFLLQIQRESWTEKQFKKFSVYRKFRNTIKTAEAIGVSQSDIHQTLTAIQADGYLEAEEDLLYYLKNYK